MKFLLNANNEPVGIISDNQKLTDKEQDLTVIDYDIDISLVRHILAHFRWDGNDFCMKATGAKFSDIRNKFDNINRGNFERQSIAENKNLQDSHVAICSSNDLEKIRQEYINKIITLIEHDGIEILMSALRHGCYSDIYHAIKNLPPKTKRAMADCKVLSEADKDLLARVWKVISR